MSSSRRLAAIMFADIAGYTSLMENDEVLAMKYREKMKQKLEAEALLHNGKIIKWMGDGVLCSFSSAIESVRVALALQSTMQQEPEVPVRIGIHQADVIFEESDVHGDGVNIASRLESMAIPGSIFISAKVFDDIKNQKEIQTISLGKYLLKNVKEPVEIFAISNPGLKVPVRKKLEGKGIKYVSARISIGKKTFLFRTVFVLLILFLAGYLIIPPIIKKQYARTELLPAIQNLAEENFLVSTKAFDLAKEAEKYIPGDSALINLWPRIAWPISFVTNPASADVYWKDYHDTTENWKHLGKTPLKDIWIPKGFTRIKIEKKGFATILSPPTLFVSELNLKLDSMTSIPKNMVRVYSAKSDMLIVGLEQHNGKEVNDFFIDRYEVTNKEFKLFVDAGGYNNKTYWDQPVYLDAKEISWEQAMALFHDKTGKPGPAEWEVGAYPPGMDDHPVTGISWYEAMAYAKFISKTLPTVYHWSLIANTINTWGIIPKSNINAKGTVPVGSSDGISYWGVQDIAGNAREWCLNENEKSGWHYILGGGWNDPTYAFNDGHAEPATNRSLSNGFRCMKILPGDTTYRRLSHKVEFAFRDYQHEKPVNDETFKVFLRQFVYDHSPLNSEAMIIADSNFFKVEKITMDAAYDKEKLEAYLFLPKNVSAPFQTILFYPGSGVINLKKFDYRQEMLFVIDFLLKSGRAVCYPVLKGTFERGDNLRSDLPTETAFYKEHVISWSQDISRTLDYLQTRKDIVPNQFGYFGFSWGSAMGPVMCATEPRFQAAVYHVGGLMMQRSFPETDVLNFLPRVKIPVLMLNGKNDTFFPLETSQKPMFKLLGTDEKDKKFIVYEGGHLVPRSELIKESLAWLDKYLGPVK